MNACAASTKFVGASGSDVVVLTFGSMTGAAVVDELAEPLPELQPARNDNDTKTTTHDVMGRRLTAKKIVDRDISLHFHEINVHTCFVHE